MNNLESTPHYAGWQQEGFFAKADTSQLIPFLNRYTLLGTVGNRFTIGNVSHYRVIGQDFFVDVICYLPPSIKAIKA